jgi:AcrR family transcriptional regulator
MQTPTRERLLREALRLFASRGFAGTTVGEIEAAAGLQPRRGALYRHFPSKVALLEAAVSRVTASVSEGEVEFTNIPLDDPRGTAVLVGRFILANLDMQRHLTHIFERDGERLGTVRDQFRESSDAGFRAASDALRQWALAANLDVDTDAFAVLLIGGLINFRRSTWTLGGSPIGLDDDRFLEGFATIFSMIVDQHRTR